MKPLNRKNYGSIPHLSNSKLGAGDHFIEKGQERILTEKVRDKHDDVFVFEKYDGSNVGVAKKDGKIFALTRSGYEAKTSNYKQHLLFNDWVLENEDRFLKMLNEGERVCGELLFQSHSLVYEIENGFDPVIFFDLFDEKNKRTPMFEFFERVTDSYFQIPRMIHFGSSVKVSDLIDKLNNYESPYKTLNDNPEGMVYRVERKGKVDFLAKWVREDFEPGKLIIDKSGNELTWNKSKML